MYSAHIPVTWLLVVPEVVLDLALDAILVLLNLSWFITMFLKTVENVRCFADELVCPGQLPLEVTLLRLAHVLFPFEP